MENRPKLRRAALAAALALPALAVWHPGGTFAHAQQAARTIEGHVFDAGAAPLSGAVIYLQDQKTNVVKSFIAPDDGAYRFGQLPASTDYKVWAMYQGSKSKERLVSSFETKQTVTIDFHIGK